MTRTTSCVADAAGTKPVRGGRPGLRVGARVLAGSGLTATLIIGLLIGPAHAQQNTASVSVDYDALDYLGTDDQPIVIPATEAGKPLVLRPPHGVARYTPTTPKMRLASLSSSSLCSCAHHLVLKHFHAHKKHTHHKPAQITPAADVIPAPTHHAPQHAAIEEPASPAMKPVAAPPKPAPEPVQAAKPVAPPAPPVKTAAAPPAPVAPPPTPPAPAKVAVAPPAPPPPAPAPVAAAHPPATQWSAPDSSTAKPSPPVVSLPSAQVLTPPPLPKAPEKPEEKAVAAVQQPPAPTPVPAAPGKPVEITKPPAEVAAIAPPVVKPADTKVAAAVPVVISYADGGSAVPAASLPTVKDISDQLAADPNLRVQLFSYASDSEKNVSRARRLSLERAVAVRKVLIDNGLDSTRIEVRALGDQNNGGESDRVDVVLSARH